MRLPFGSKEIVLRISLEFLLWLHNRLGRWRLLWLLLLHWLLLELRLRWLLRLLWLLKRLLRTRRKRLLHHTFHCGSFFGEVVILLWRLTLRRPRWFRRLR